MSKTSLTDIIKLRNDRSSNHDLYDEFYVSVGGRDIIRISMDNINSILASGNELLIEDIISDVCIEFYHLEKKNGTPFNCYIKCENCKDITIEVTSCKIQYILINTSSLAALKILNSTIHSTSPSSIQINPHKLATIRLFEIESSEIKGDIVVENVILPSLILHDIQIDKLKLFNCKINTFRVIPSKKIDTINELGIFNSVLRSFSIEAVDNNRLCQIGTLKFDAVKAHELYWEKPIITTTTFDKCDVKNIGCNLSIIDNLSFSVSSIENTHFSNCQINQISFEGSISKESVIDFNNMICMSILFNSFINFGKIYFRNVNSNLSHCQPGIETIKTDRLIRIRNSDLGQVQFLSCTFRGKGWKYEFVNSKILGIEILGSYFPDHPYIDNMSTAEYKQQRFLYGQLSKVYENQGNRVRALFYRKSSIGAYQKELANKDKISHREWFDLQSLRLYWVTNGFDYNLSVSALWLMGYSIFSYVCYLLLCDQPLQICWNCKDSVSRFLFYLAKYFEFINPIHKVQFIEDINSNYSSHIPIKAKAVLLDNVSRVIIVFLTYQFVQAFRKFGRAQI